MKLNTDITRIGWLIAGIVLAGSGVRHVVVQEMYGRVHTGGEPPLMEGWPVFGMGLAELAAGVLLLLWSWRRLRDGDG